MLAFIIHLFSKKSTENRIIFKFIRSVIIKGLPSSQQPAIDQKILVLEHIEDDLDAAIRLRAIFPHGIDRDLRGFSLRKAEHARRDTAERDALHAVFLG